MSGRRGHLRASVRRRGHPGITLLEVLVASVVMTGISLAIYSAFEHTGNIRARLGDRQERDHLARIGLARIARDFRSAFLSAHVNTTPTNLALFTTFLARDLSPGDRVDFTTFTHRRLVRNAHEGDACEVGYRLDERRGGSSRVYDLLRRESPRIDTDPTRGGAVDVLIPDVIDFQIRYYDVVSERWLDAWDSTEATEQKGRLPARARITLTLRGIDGRESRYLTETQFMVQELLRFGLPVDYR